MLDVLHAWADLLDPVLNTTLKLNPAITRLIPKGRVTRKCFLFVCLVALVLNFVDILLQNGDVPGLKHSLQFVK